MSLRPSRARLSGGPRPGQATPLRSVPDGLTGLTAPAVRQTDRQLRDGLRRRPRCAPQVQRDLFEDFCHEYVPELNRLRMEHRAGLSHGRQELASVERAIRKLIQAIKDGVSALSIKDELLSLEARKAELQSRLNAPEMPELLHPRMADVYREKVGSLCSALENEERRSQST